MSWLVRGLVLLMFGLALGLAFNTWPIAEEARFATGNGVTANSIDIFSYGAGLVVGMMLWQIGSVPWAALPKQMHHFLVSKMEFYKFIALGSACVAILFYF
ncbi:MAG: hypothetical protein ACI9XZ_003427 [Alphaproteobacteria bacterium]|jgi:hypothetical protein